jgi:type IV pilus assembly protein PilO
VNLDLSQFDNLELDNIGQWPPLAKAVFTVFVAIIVLGLGYVFLVSDKLTRLDAVKAEEVTLKQQYQTKYHVAANLELFRQQMAEAEALFANQLKSLPESHETPGLLDDITHAGTTSALSFSRLNWQPEIVQEIYIELPIDISVVGSYHDFGNFVSKVAGLPRIVTIHDFTIALDEETGTNLFLDIQAKTYRYREQEATE